MFCRHCGKEAAEGTTFCAGCGAPLSGVAAPVTDGSPATPPQQPDDMQQTAPTEPVKKKKNGLSIAGFILSLLPFFWTIGLILSIVGVVNYKKCGSGKGLGITGIVFGAIGTLVFIIAIFAIALAPLIGLGVLFEAFRRFFEGEMASVIYVAATAIGF